MEKFLKVTVNGIAYDVKIEDVKEGEVVKSTPNVATVESVTTPSAPAPVPEPEIKATPATSVAGSGNIKVTAPMPGNIWKIKTSVGATVNKHDVLLILEAMKMENEIVAPEAGTVTAILVKEGDSVEPGKVMVEMA